MGEDVFFWGSPRFFPPFPPLPLNATRAPPPPPPPTQPRKLQAKQYFLGLESNFGGSGNPAYPGGGFFDLFNLSGKDEASTKTLRLKEIKNGRLAMLAMLGMGAQAVMTGEGPVQNLVSHLSNPTANNILTNFAKVGGAL
jgi:hypothetical protein